MIPAHELCVPIDPVQGARHDVLLHRVDRPGEGFHPIGHPIRPRSRLRYWPPRSFHHFVSHPAKEEGISLLEVLGVVTMHVFVRDYCTMIAAPVQGDVDGIPKGSHYVFLKRANAYDKLPGQPLKPPGRAETVRAAPVSFIGLILIMASRGMGRRLSEALRGTRVRFVP